MLLINIGLLDFSVLYIEHLREGKKEKNENNKKNQTRTHQKCGKPKTLKNKAQTKITGNNGL